MSNDKLAELEHRIEIAEREVEKTRAQVRALQEKERPRSRAARAGVLGLLGLSLVLAVTRTHVIEAQGGRPQPQALTVKAPFKVVDGGGRTMMLVDNIDGAPGLFVGDPAYGFLSINFGESSARGLTLTDKGGKIGAVIGRYKGAPMGISVFGPDGQNVEASLAAGQKGGSVKAMNPQGVGVAALLAGDTGGGLALTGPAGGKSAVSLSVESSGGKVRVFPEAGGSTGAELKATPAGGELDVYNKQGEAVGWLEATSGGNGKFTIGRAGNIYVEAAVLENGKGMIIAGPDVGGAPPGLVIPYYLEGRKK